MPGEISLEKVEALAAQLSPSEQLKLIAQIGGRLSAEFPMKVNNFSDEKAREKRLAEADALLAKLDAIAESIEGEFDSVKDIREIREERANRL